MKGCRRRFVRLIPHASYLILALLCGGCLRRELPADLVIINGQEPGTLDPALAVTLEELRATLDLFEGLLRVDPVDAKPIPGLAERWEISPDGRVYTFYLRTNAVWSTGEPITAPDVAWSWRRVLEPATASSYAGQLYPVKNAEAYNSGALKDASQLGFKAIDGLTFRVELNSPTAYFLDLCAFQTLAVVPRRAIERFGDAWIRARPLPVSGPYQLDFWRLKDRVRLRKNPRYWDAPNTRSGIVDLLPASTASTAFNLYEAGQADIIWDKDFVPTELLAELRGRPDYHAFPYLGSYFIRINNTRDPFKDARVRRALALAVDKRRLVTKLLRAGESPASHLVPPSVRDYTPPSGLDYDPEQARRLLAEAGFPGGKGFPTVQYLFDPAPIHGGIGVELQQMWQDTLGIRVELRQMEKKVYIAAQDKLEYDLSRSSWIGDYNDANTFLGLFTSGDGNNRTGWKNSRYDDFMRRANLETDRARRAALLREAESLLVREELPIIPLYFYSGFNYYSPQRVKGVHPNSLDLHPIRAIQKVSVASRQLSVGATAGLQPTIDH
jgi:oligopeptide transport system substrate-binding protein